MDIHKVVDFVEAAIKNHFTYNSTDLAGFSRDDLTEILSLLLLRVQSREKELVDMVDKLEKRVHQRTAELMEKNRILEDKVTHDALTKIFNRRYFDEKLSEYSLLTERFSQTLTCIMCDIDHFKTFNDTYGHQAGDFILQSIAQILKINTRTTDIVARYGGEEFVILLPNTSHRAGMKLSEKLRKLVESAELEYEGKILKTTISFGVATGHKENELEADLVKKADLAMYKAKQTGRNRVCG